jgi:DNA topoisomerase-1
MALEAFCLAEQPASESARKRLVASIMRATAEKLANTPAVTRSSYVHPLVIEAFEAGRLAPAVLATTPRAGLDRAESALTRLLEEELTGRAAVASADARNGSGGGRPQSRIRRREKRTWLTKVSTASGRSSTTSMSA